MASDNLQSQDDDKNSIISKITNVVLILLIIGLAVIQFIFPIAEKDGQMITSFQGLSYLNLHWGFAFFYFVALVVITAIILFVISLKKETSKWYDFSLWVIAFVGLLVFMIALQGFLNANPSLGIEDNAKAGVFSFLLIGIAAFIAIGKLYSQYEKVAEKTIEKISTPEFKQAIKNKKIIYENTIHLNPKWNVTLKYPGPSKMAVTEKEIIISSTPLTKIPFSNIKSITLNPIYQMALRVNCRDGRKYKIIWAPANKAVPYSLLETQDIKDNLNRIFKKGVPLNK